jgi:hypothetical protein
MAIRAADEGMDVRTVVPASSRVASTSVELVDVDAVDWSLRQSGLQMRVWTYGGACF